MFSLPGLLLWGWPGGLILASPQHRSMSACSEATHASLTWLTRMRTQHKLMAAGPVLMCTNTGHVVLSPPLSSLFRVPRSCAPSATPSQHLETCGGFTYELAGQAGLASSNPPAPASVTVTLPLPLYILAHRFPVYIHAHTHPHIEDSGARVEQPCLLVPSELGDHASLGCFQSGQKAG